MKNCRPHFVAAIYNLFNGYDSVATMHLLLIRKIYMDIEVVMEQNTEMFISAVAL